MANVRIKDNELHPFRCAAVDNTDIKLRQTEVNIYSNKI